MALRHEDEKICKIWIAKEHLDAFNDIMVIDIKHFICNDDLVALELQMTWKFIINYLVQFTGVLEGEIKFFAKLETQKLDQSPDES